MPCTSSGSLAHQRAGPAGIIWRGEEAFMVPIFPLHAQEYWSGLAWGQSWVRDKHKKMKELLQPSAHTVLVHLQQSPIKLGQTCGLSCLLYILLEPWEPPAGWPKHSGRCHCCYWYSSRRGYEELRLEQLRFWRSLSLLISSRSFITRLGNVIKKFSIRSVKTNNALKNKCNKYSFLAKQI